VSILLYGGRNLNHLTPIFSIFFFKKYAITAVISNILNFLEGKTGNNILRAEGRLLPERKRTENCTFPSVMV
jgi:hypothetical protein